MRLLLLLGLALLAARAQADPLAVYLEITPAGANPLRGDTINPLYQGWSDVLNFEMGGEAPTMSIHDGTPPKLTPITRVREPDRATPFFYDLLMAGTTPTEVGLRMVVTRTAGTQVEMWDIRCDRCLLVAQNSSRSDDVEERVKFVIGDITTSYIRTDTLGQALAEYFVCFSVLTGTGLTGIRPPDYAGAPDTDGHGIPDPWENFDGLNPNVADGSTDTDGDGMTNKQEYFAHTDPRLPNSVLRITAVQKPGATTYGLTWKSVKGLSYRVLSATAPGGPYTAIKVVPSAGDGTTSTTVVGPVPPLFLRVTVP